MFDSFFVLPTPSSASSRGAARVIWLLILWRRTVFWDYFLCDACYFVSSWALPSLASLWVVPPFRFVLVFTVSPPRHDGDLRKGFDVGFPCHSACVLLQFAFLRLAPPRHAGVTREGFDGGLSCHSAFFVSRPPPRWRFARGF